MYENQITETGRLKYTHQIHIISMYKQVKYYVFNGQKNEKMLYYQGFKKI